MPVICAIRRTPRVQWGPRPHSLAKGLRPLQLQPLPIQYPLLSYRVPGVAGLNAVLVTSVSSRYRVLASGPSPPHPSHSARAGCSPHSLAPQPGTARRQESSRPSSGCSEAPARCLVTEDGGRSGLDRRVPPSASAALWPRAMLHRALVSSWG